MYPSQKDNHMWIYIVKYIESKFFFFYKTKWEIINTYKRMIQTDAKQK